MISFFNVALTNVECWLVMILTRSNRHIRNEKCNARFPNETSLHAPACLRTYENISFSPKILYVRRDSTTFDEYCWICSTERGVRVSSEIRKILKVRRVGNTRKHITPLKIRYSSEQSQTLPFPTRCFTGKEQNSKQSEICYRVSGVQYRNISIISRHIGQP